MKLADGPRHVVWTRDSAPEWDGVKFGDSKMPGVRSLRIGWSKSLRVGTVLARAGGQLSALKPTAVYPGRLDFEEDWIPAERIQRKQVVRTEPDTEEFALWALPPDTDTRALRFTHRSAAAEIRPTRAGSGASLFWGNAGPTPLRKRKLLPAVTTKPPSNSTTTPTTTFGLLGIMTRKRMHRRFRPSILHGSLLNWPAPVRIAGLNLLWAGFTAVEVQASCRSGRKRILGKGLTPTGKPLRPLVKSRTSIPARLARTGLTSVKSFRRERFVCGLPGPLTRPVRTAISKADPKAGAGFGWASCRLCRRSIRRAWHPRSSRPRDGLSDAADTHPHPFAGGGIRHLVIDDAAGKRVRNLVSGDQSARRRPGRLVGWDGRSPARPGGLPSWAELPPAGIRSPREIPRLRLVAEGRSICVMSSRSITLATRRGKRRTAREPGWQTIRRLVPLCLCRAAARLQASRWSILEAL